MRSFIEYLIGEMYDIADSLDFGEIGNVEEEEKEIQ